MPIPSTRAPDGQSLQLRLRIEVEPDRDAEAVAQRRGQEPRARVAPISVNLARSIRTERAAGPSPMIRSS